MKPEYRFELKLPEATSKEYKVLRRWMVRKGYALPRSPLKSIREEYLIEHLKEYQNERKMAIIKAPFTPEQVENLNKYQRAGFFHPFTCGNKDKGGHPDDVSAILIATEKGWVCSRCDYTQDWAHDFMTQPMPKDPFDLGFGSDYPEMSGEEAREYLKREGYDPDEIVKHGVRFVKMVSLIAKIKNVIHNHEEYKSIHRKFEVIRELIEDYEEETED